MRAPLLALLAAALLGGPAAAQTTDSAAVLQVVERLFDGMRAGDTTAMRATFHPDVRLVTTGERDGVPVARAVPVAAWLSAVAGSDQVLDERLHDVEIRVAGGLATVWAYYTLYVGERFSHCGHDAFQLARTDDGWRILQVVDTRRTDGCDRREPSGPAVQNFGLAPSAIERRLAEEPLEVVALQDNRWEGDRTQRAAVRFPDGTTLRVKWARAAHGGFAINNQPRYEVAAYALQKLFLDEADWVVPPTVLRAMSVDTYRQLDPAMRPTFEETRSVLVAIQYWIADVGVLDGPDPDRIARDDQYGRRFGHLNLLTYLIRHADANPGNVLISTTGEPRMFAVDNGVAFRSPDGPNGTVWDRLRTDRLPRDAVERIRTLDRAALDSALTVVAEFRVTADGGLVSSPRSAPLDDRRGVRRAEDLVQFGLTALELDELWARRDSLLRRLDAGDITTF